MDFDQGTTSLRLDFEDDTDLRPDFEDDFLLAITFLLSQKNKKRHRYWVHPLNTQRLTESQFYVKRIKLRAHPDKFFDYYRMTVKSFDELFDKIK